MSLQKCAECGREFYIGQAGWGYGYGSLYTCSYKCMRDMERRQAKIVTDEEKKRVDELQAAGLDADGIAQETGIKKIAVVTYLGKKKKKESGGPGAADTVEPEQPEEKTQPACAAREKVEMERYRVGWMCPMCRMVWSPWISACNCQRKEKK